MKKVNSFDGGVFTGARVYHRAGTTEQGNFFAGQASASECHRVDTAKVNADMKQGKANIHRWYASAGTIECALRQLFREEENSIES